MEWIFPFDLGVNEVKVQAHSDLRHRLPVCKPCPINNQSLVGPSFFIFLFFFQCTDIDFMKCMLPVYILGNKLKVKVTVTVNIDCQYQNLFGSVASVRFSPAY